MHAVILAAGIGDRLGDTAGGRPKCLLEFNGVSLLARHCRNLLGLGVDGITVVTGHEAGQVSRALLAACGNRASTVFNPDFRSGSVVSLHSARESITGGADILLMDADVLYHPCILQKLVRSKHGNCFLLDRDFVPGDEPVKLCLRAGRVVEFRKRLAPGLEFDVQGESVGFFRFSPALATRLAGQTAGYVAAGRLREPYEEVIRDLALSDPDCFGVEDVTGQPWIEIDFPDDVRRAREEILPRIDER